MRTLVSINLGDLRDVLERAERLHGGDYAVVITADYGDRAHTEQALPLRGVVEERSVEVSAYSASGFAIVPEHGEPGNDCQTVLLLF